MVAILGVETKYGRITGKYRVLDALATLAFDYPPRSDFFRSELAQFLLLAQARTTSTRSRSWAPTPARWARRSSCPRATVATRWTPTATPHRDLWGDWDDVFASVANYLREHGWQPDGPVLAEATARA